MQLLMYKINKTILCASFGSFTFRVKKKIDKITKTRTRADQHKCLPHLACINPTLFFIEYFSFFGRQIENEFKI